MWSGWEGERARTGPAFRLQLERRTLLHVGRSTNGGLSAFRDVGRPGEDYPQWVQALKGRSGVYAIRHRGVLVYVGESHTGRIYETMTRHLQHWTLPSSHAYNRGDCSVAVRVLSDPTEAPAVQAHYICELNPRDNEYERCGDDAAPF